MSEKYIKEQIEKIRKETKGVPVNKEFIEALLRIRDESQEVKEAFSKEIHKSFQKSGTKLILRAFYEEVFTEKEFLKINKKYGFDDSDWSTILQCYFHEKEKEDDLVTAVTTEESPLYKHRDFLKKRFKVNVLSPQEAMDRMLEDVKKREDTNNT